jgi:hypothetical protein
MLFNVYTADKLNFVELNITGTGDMMQRCDRGSLYMDTELFNLFADCFENSNSMYDYMGPNKYNFRNIIVLLNELKENLKNIENIDERIDLIEFLNSKFWGTSFENELEKTDSHWKDNWKVYKKKLSDVNKKLLDIVNECIEQDRVLWVIGY